MDDQSQKSGARLFKQARLFGEIRYVGQVDEYFLGIDRRPRS